jgi:hypothetical protein
VNNLRRIIANEDLSTVAKSLLKNWKKLVPGLSIQCFSSFNFFDLLSKKIPQDLLVKMRNNQHQRLIVNNHKKQIPVRVDQSNVKQVNQHPAVIQPHKHMMKLGRKENVYLIWK